MSDATRYEAVHLRYEENNIRYGEGCEVEVVAGYDYDKLKEECSNLKARAFVNTMTHVSGVTMLVGELEALQRNLGDMRAELSACTATLPGTLYMDPPDGGDVSVPEQLARMAADAAKWRECEAVRQRVLNVWELPPADGDLPGVKPRREILDLAIAQGAILTGKPDGSESIQLIFSILAWRSFDAALLEVKDEAKD